MPRLQLPRAERYPFATEIAIRDEQINEGDHLDNVELLRIVSRARERFFAWLGHQPIDVEGHACFVADQAIQYRSEGLPGETLRVEMAPADLAAKGFDLLYRVTERESGREIALGKIGLVCVELGQRKPAALPDRFRQQLLAL